MPGTSSMRSRRCFLATNAPAPSQAIARMGGVGDQPCRIARPPGIFPSRNGGSDYAADGVDHLADGITVPNTEVEMSDAPPSSRCCRARTWASAKSVTI